MSKVPTKTLATAALAAIALVGFSACSSDNSNESTTTTTNPGIGATSSMASVTTTPMADPAADLIGSACGDYAAENPRGPGSITGMSRDPVATAASHNPLLATLAAALSGKLNPDVNLVDTLNNGQYTVFAPTDAAFNKLPATTIDKLKTDAPLLNKILTYHVVQGQLSPAKVDGTHKTLQGADVNVTGYGNDLKANESGLVCGGVHTANATVYMIDTVMMPPGQ